VIPSNVYSVPSSGPCDELEGGTHAAAATPTPAIDAAAIRLLSGYLPRLNERAVPITEAAMAAMELLYCGDTQAMEQALKRGTGQQVTSFDKNSRSVPELVQDAVERGAPFRYVFGGEPEVLAISGLFGRGWDRLESGRKGLSPPPPGVDRNRYLAILKSSVFSPSIEQLRTGECMVLLLPHSDVAMVARDAQGELLAVTHSMPATTPPSLKLFRGRDAGERLSAGIQLSSSSMWGMVRSATRQEGASAARDQQIAGLKSASC